MLLPECNQKQHTSNQLEDSVANNEGTEVVKGLKVIKQLGGIIVFEEGTYCNNIEIGEFTIGSNQFGHIGGGLYVNGVKDGPWIELYEMYTDVKDNTSEYLKWKGMYNKGKQINQWIIESVNGVEFGGGMFNQQGHKIEQWKEVHDMMYNNLYFIEEGLYKDNLRVGPWFIKNKEQIYGGGEYENGVKVGFWRELYTKMCYNVIITESGYYQEGVKNGKWVIEQDQNINIGGGNYENGLKQGQWFEADIYHIPNLNHNTFYYEDLLYAGGIVLPEPQQQIEPISQKGKKVKKGIQKKQTQKSKQRKPKH